MRGIHTLASLATGLCFFAISAPAADSGRLLRVSPKSRYYFVDGAGKPVYLTGSHTWTTIQDRAAGPFDYPGFLDLLQKYNHNFTRLWTWEDVNYTPLPYVRTGPGAATDGKPKFDLDKFNPEFFDRLRQRVMLARDRGIYVSVMMFQGWSGRKDWRRGVFKGHPYYAQNNINGHDGDRNKDFILDLNDPLNRARDAAFVRHAIDTVGDLDNLIWEVSNEGGTQDWNWFIVDTIHQYEKGRPLQHPAGITAHGYERLDTQAKSPADWISPGSLDVQEYMSDPPAPGFPKISILDTDHVFGTGGDGKWVWKSFLRGHSVIFMDPCRPTEMKNDLGLDVEAARKAMGQTLAMAKRLDLAAVSPRNDLSSTGYCLAAPGRQNVVYLSEDGAATVDLSAVRNTLSGEWLHPLDGSVTRGEPVTGGGTREFRAPFGGDAVLFLYRP